MEYQLRKCILKLKIKVKMIFLKKEKGQVDKQR